MAVHCTVKNDCSKFNENLLLTLKLFKLLTQVEVCKLLSKITFK